MFLLVGTVFEKKIETYLRNIVRHPSVLAPEEIDYVEDGSSTSPLKNSPSISRSRTVLSNTDIKKKNELQEEQPTVTHPQLTTMTMTLSVPRQGSALKVAQPESDRKPLQVVAPTSVQTNVCCECAKSMEIRKKSRKGCCW
ncbi:uncharacterized protein LOC113226588 isoform X2 [Hyposmocoma kahamanoa]|uniref:uncharacterized protein LOC113226588 isoform X2 n=1 Tax=Hyposmocoma kahamanoa TaxID=1477025 RepID=UPI000E6D7C64|nr:uncharacterized protein LOC113226588 isoform X2 [Hyposmocoma kahamanoa]